MGAKICQSCSMPLTKSEELGTNQDGSSNGDYCIYCYKDGAFIDNVSIEEYIEMNVQFAEQAGMTKEQMREHCGKIFPTLKRWKRSKYEPLWQHLRADGREMFKMTYDEIKGVLGFDVDHSFLNAKKEAVRFGYTVDKISMKEKCVSFHKI